MGAAASGEAGGRAGSPDGAVSRTAPASFASPDTCGADAAHPILPGTAPCAGYGRCHCLRCIRIWPRLRCASLRAGEGRGPGAVLLAAAATVARAADAQR